MTLEGWVPEIGPYLTLAEVIEFAFDYRGNTTIVKRDGAEIVGYVFNRDARGATPFIQYFDEQGAGPFTLPFDEIANVKFTGKDTAAGNSWKAWLERRDKDQGAKPAETGAQGLARDPHPDRG